MSCYGWTIKETMELTFPQMTMLFSSMARIPPMNVLAAGLLKAIEKSGGSDISLEALGSVETPTKEKALEFFRSLKKGNG